ncbi:MAG: hypothetical protein WAN12_05215 [Candidatus Acidiferrum sp.]
MTCRVAWLGKLIRSATRRKGGEMVNTGTGAVVEVAKSKKCERGTGRIRQIGRVW